MKISKKATCLKAISKLPPFTAMQAALKLDVSIEYARQIAKDLVEKGMLITARHNRVKVYSASQKLLEIIAKGELQ